MTQAQLWRKEVILIANLLPAIVNFFTSVLLSKFIGFEFAGIWFFLRSLSQISISISPGFLQALLIKNYIYSFEENIISIARVLSIIWSIINFFIFLLLLQVVSNSNSLISLYICFYWLSLSLFSYYSLILRVKLHGKAILNLSLLDATLSIFILGSLFYVSLEWFILLNSIKFFLKAVLAKRYLNDMKPLFENVETLNFNSYLVSSKELFNIGGGLSFKGIIQTVSQYGDKFFLGLIVSNTVLGFVSLGGSLGLPLAVFLSSFYTWSLPFFKNQDYISKNLKFFVLLLALILFYPLSAFSLYLIYDFSQEEFYIVFYSLIFMELLLVLNFSCALLFNKFGTWRSSSCQLTIVVIVYAMLYFCFSIDIDFVYSLSISSLFLLAVTIFILYIPFKWKALSILPLSIYIIYPLYI